MRSDWSRIASYFAIITLLEATIAGAPNLRMAASRYVNVSEEVINVIQENLIAKSTKNAKRLTEHLFKRII